MSEAYVIAALIFLNVAQFIFWGIQNNKLVNKLMSKNFAEYDLVKNGPPKAEKEVVGFSEYEETLEDKEYLAELNGQVGTMFR